jgi:hypothetical protein
LTIFDEFQLCTMKVHVKWSLHIKRSLNLDTPCGSYAPLIMGHFWNWMDHNLPTIHGNFKFLDFLERWDQDLQLSCWTNFHLKLPWTCNFVVKNFPFLETSITSHFLFLAISCLTWFSPFLSFEMSNNTCSNMNEVYPTLSHLQIHKIKHSWPQLTFQLIDEFGNALIKLSPNSLMKWLKDETLASISSI